MKNKKSFQLPRTVVLLLLSVFVEHTTDVFVSELRMHQPMKESNRERRLESKNLNNSGGH